MFRRSIISVVAVGALGMLALLAIACNGSDETHADAYSTVDVEAQVAFSEDMRKLWEDHVIWTRMVIVSMTADLPDLNFAVERLLQNQADIGNAIKPFYGEEAGDKLTALLKDHIVIAADLLGAAKAGDTAKVDSAKLRWYANADDIATFLSGANPTNWPVDAMKHHMRDHLNLTLEEAVARLQGDWAGDVAAYDKIHLQILSMADALSTGIIDQFPNHFAQTD